jgi:hypothetical protein
MSVTPAPRLRHARFELAEQCRTVYFVKPEMGTTVNDMLAPEYWTHVASKLKSLDRIEAVAEDGSWFADFIVLHGGAVSAKVVLLHRVQLETVDPAAMETETHEVKWRGPVVKWSVVRKSDGLVLKDGFPSKADAAEHMARHIRAMAA